MQIRGHRVLPPECGAADLTRRFILQSDIKGIAARKRTLRPLAHLKQTKVVPAETSLVTHSWQASGNFLGQ